MGGASFKASLQIRREVYWAQRGAGTHNDASRSGSAKLGLLGSQGKKNLRPTASLILIDNIDTKQPGNNIPEFVEAYWTSHICVILHLCKGCHKPALMWNGKTIHAGLEHTIFPFLAHRPTNWATCDTQQFSDSWQYRCLQSEKIVFAGLTASELIPPK